MNGSQHRLIYDSTVDSLELPKNEYKSDLETHSFGLISNGRECDPLIFYTQPKKRGTKCCSCETFFGKSYDILTVLISILDVSTDIIVCVEFYQKDRMIFFSISVAILILALLAYDLAFVFRFSREYYPTPQICLMICLLPLTPCLPFVFYLTDSRDRNLSIFIENNCCFDIEMEDPRIPDDASKLRRFMEAKIAKHLGFILEALVEAFPQAILQMTAVVFYNEASYIPIISILISLLSVASKSFVFSIAISLTMKQLIFNWLCAITDFFSIFVAICWVFYAPKNDHDNDNLNDAFDFITFVWFAKLICLVLPLIIFLSIVLHLVATYEFTNSNRPHDGVGETIFRAMIGFVLVTFLWICGIIASILTLEVLNWTWLAGTLFHLGTERFPSNKTSSEFYFTLMQWINSASKHNHNSCTSFTKSQDKMMRLCSVNYIAMNNLAYEKDYKWEKYLNQQKDSTQYMNVTFSDLRKNTLVQNKSKSQFMAKFYKWYAEIWHGEYKYAKELFDSLDVWSCYNAKRCCKQSMIAWVFWMVTFIFAPVYFISRFLTLCFPFWIVFYLYIWHDINIWNSIHVHTFQMVMISIYFALCAILSILFCYNCKEQYLMAHILPYINSLPQINYQHTVKQTIKQITNHYYEIVVIPIRKALICEFFGDDLGNIILSYLPVNDNYNKQTDKNVVRIKTVV